MQILIYSIKLQNLPVDRQFKHDLGYWMTVFGAAATIITLFAGSLLQVNADLLYPIFFVEVIIFIVGIELALRNQRHHEHFP